MSDRVTVGAGLLTQKWHTSLFGTVLPFHTTCKLVSLAVLAGPGVLAAAAVAVLTLLAAPIRERYSSGDLESWLSQVTLFDCDDAEFFSLVVGIEGRSRGALEGCWTCT